MKQEISYRKISFQTLFMSNYFINHNKLNLVHLQLRWIHSL
jgi:hypothetical protein